MQAGPIEVIKKDRLYFLISNKPPKDIPKALYFNIDNDLAYDSFYEDFGPLNLSKIWKYVTEVNKILQGDNHKDHKFYHQTSEDYKKNTNACLLICAFQMIILKKTADQAFQPFKKIEFVPFRDASKGVCTYKCTILDCLRGLEYAMKLGWFDFKKFDNLEYEHYENIDNGDINSIIPNKMYAFSTPSDTKQDEYGNFYNTPKDYLPIFNKLGINGIIRLNTAIYSKEQFTNNGFNHYDLYFPDGSCPPHNIVNQFLEITEKEEVFAIHCKAGLGRTGCLIACYAMKNYGFNAADFIAWIRICRPGSVIGPQQYFLLQIEKQLKLKGKDSKIRKEIQEKIGADELEKQMKKLSMKDQKMSEQEKKIGLKGDKGQGEHLLNKKKSLKNHK